jgi:hypothetical protein
MELRVSLDDEERFVEKQCVVVTHEAMFSTKLSVDSTKPSVVPIKLLGFETNRAVLPSPPSAPQCLSIFDRAPSCHLPASVPLVVKYTDVPSTPMEDGLDWPVVRISAVPPSLGTRPTPVENAK